MHQAVSFKEPISSVSSEVQTLLCKNWHNQTKDLPNRINSTFAAKAE